MTPINPSTIAIAERYARDHFNLSLPLKADELKSAFRAAARKLHTDTSGDENTKNQFIEMKSAYDFLVKLGGMEFVYGERATTGIRLETTDGTPLYELGLGLGPMKNGRDCERCQHKGYIEEDRLDNHCFSCNSQGLVLASKLCGPCRGTGRFAQRGGRIVACRVCGGLGKKHSWHECPKCNGTKRIGESRVRYFKCYKCNGSGEIELFSPLFPKGRIINVARR